MVLSASQVIQDTCWVKLLPYQFPNLLLAGAAESSCRLFAKVISGTILNYFFFCDEEQLFQRWACYIS